MEVCGLPPFDRRNRRVGHPRHGLGMGGAPAQDTKESMTYDLWGWQTRKRLDNMSTEGYIPPHLDEAALKAVLLQALVSAPSSGTMETLHARFDHLERGLSVDDVIHGLEREWNFDRKPVFNQDEWQWKYYIATESIDGDGIVIVIAVDTANRSFEVVTRWK